MTAPFADVTEEDIVGLMSGFRERDKEKTEHPERYMFYMEYIAREEWKVFPKISLAQLASKLTIMSPLVEKAIVASYKLKSVNKWEGGAVVVKSVDEGWLNAIPHEIVSVSKSLRVWMDRDVIEEGFHGLLKALSETEQTKQMALLTALALRGAVAEVLQHHPLLGRSSIARRLYNIPRKVLMDLRVGGTRLNPEWAKMLKKVICSGYRADVPKEEDLTDEETDFVAPRYEEDEFWEKTQAVTEADIAREDEEEIPERVESERMQSDEEMPDEALPESPVLDFEPIPLPKERILPVDLTKKTKAPRKPLPKGDRAKPKKLSYNLSPVGDGEWAQICREQAARWTAIFSEELKEGKLPPEAEFKRGDTITPELWNANGKNAYQKNRFKRFSQYQMFTRRMRKKRDREEGLFWAPLRKRKRVPLGELSGDVDIDLTTETPSEALREELSPSFVAPPPISRDEAKRSMVAASVLRNTEKSLARSALVEEGRKEKERRKNRENEAKGEEVKETLRSGFSGVIEREGDRLREEHALESVEMDLLDEILDENDQDDWMRRRRARRMPIAIEDEPLVEDTGISERLELARIEDEKQKRDAELESKRIEAEREREKQNADIREQKIAAELRVAEMKIREREHERKIASERLAAEAQARENAHSVIEEARRIAEMEVLKENQNRERERLELVRMRQTGPTAPGSFPPIGSEERKRVLQEQAEASKKWREEMFLKGVEIRKQKALEKERLEREEAERIAKETREREEKRATATPLGLLALDEEEEGFEGVEERENAQRALLKTAEAKEREELREAEAREKEARLFRTREAKRKAKDAADWLLKQKQDLVLRRAQRDRDTRR